MLEKELKNKDSEFTKFIDDTYMYSVAYGTNIYTQESGKTVMNGTAAGTNAEGADKLTLTLQRRPGTEADYLTAGRSIPYGSADDLATALSEMESPAHTVKDLELDVTVKAEKDGVSYAYTVNYVRSAHYEVSYYTLNTDDTTHYDWNEEEKKFCVGDIKVGVDDRPTVTLHYNTTPKPTNITYTRGLRSQKGAT